MIIVEIEPLHNGAHRNQTLHGAIPSGWAAVPNYIQIPDSFPFVDITVDGNTVISMTPGVVPEPEPEPEPEPTEQEDAAAMLVDHEYRLTLLELGLAE